MFNSPNRIQPPCFHPKDVSIILLRSPCSMRGSFRSWKKLYLLIGEKLLADCVVLRTAPTSTTVGDGAISTGKDGGIMETPTQSFSAHLRLPKRSVGDVKMHPTAELCRNIAYDILSELRPLSRNGKTRIGKNYLNIPWRGMSASVVLPSGLWIIKNFMKNGTVAVASAKRRWKERLMSTTLSLCQEAVNIRRIIYRLLMPAVIEAKARGNGENPRLDWR